MKCDKCKKEFNPRKDGDLEVTGGYDEVIEVVIHCPHCEATFSHWIGPKDWRWNTIVYGFIFQYNSELLDF